VVEPTMDPVVPASQLGVLRRGLARSGPLFRYLIPPRDGWHTLV